MKSVFFMGLKEFFQKIKENLSHISSEDIARFTTKTIGDMVPFIGPIIKNAADDFYPNNTDKLLEELANISKVELESISRELNIQTTEILSLVDFSEFHFQSMKSDHSDINKLLLEIHAMIQKLLKKPQYVSSSHQVSSHNTRFLKDILKLLRRFVDSGFREERSKE